MMGESTLLQEKHAFTDGERKEYLQGFGSARRLVNALKEVDEMNEHMESATRKEIRSALSMAIQNDGLPSYFWEGKYDGMRAAFEWSDM